MRHIALKKYAVVGAVVALTTALAVCVQTFASVLPVAYGLRRNVEWVPSFVRQFPASATAVGKLYGPCFLAGTATAALLRKWPGIAVPIGGLVTVVSWAAIVPLIYPQRRSHELRFYELTRHSSSPRC